MKLINVKVLSLVCAAMGCMHAACANDAVLEMIVGRSGINGGVIACVGCDDGFSAIPLKDLANARVQVLEADAGKVEQEFKRILAANAAETITVKQWENDYLPYADNLVNLVVYAKPVGDAAPDLVAREIGRVLVPNGTAAICKVGNSALISNMKYPATELGNGYVLYRKPRSPELGDWSHWLNGADGNPVAKDTVSGPPTRIQWTASPRRVRSHDTGISMTGMVSGGGLLFYIADEGIVGMSDKEGHRLEQWALFCRDAFNGVLIWKKPMEEWGMREWSPLPSKGDGYGPWAINPRMVHKRLVYADDHLFVTLGFRSNVSMLDAKTGKKIREFAGTEFTSEIIVKGDAAYLVVDAAAKRAGEYVANPGNTVVAVNTGTGKILWRTDEVSGIKDNRERGLTATLSRLQIIAGGEQVYFIDKGEVVALNAATGKTEWKFKRPPLASQRNPKDKHIVNNDWDLSNMLYSDGVLYFWQGIHPPTRQSYYKIKIFALSETDGKPLWSKECMTSTFLSSLPSIYMAQGLIWAEEASGNRAASKNMLVGMDPKKGTVVKRHDISEIFKTVHHHRCYPNKATGNYLIFSRNGLEYVDFKTGEINMNRWLRGVCQYGIMPANGLLYTPADPCACFVSARINGYHAYAGAPVDETPRPKPTGTLVKGPAYSSGTRAAHTDANEWPIYRRGGKRSGASPTVVSDTPGKKWNTALGEPVTAPTVAGGRVYVATRNSNRIVALDAKGGQRIWAFRAEGGVDTPPTICNGNVYFGTRDGYVYCLRAADGALSWRFNANPAARLVVSYGKLESAWPVNGTVVVKKNAVVCLAGRSTYLDGGLRFIKLDALTGKLLLEKTVARNPQADAAAKENLGTAADLLVCDASNLYLRNLSLDLKTFSQPKTHPWSIAGPNRLLPGNFFTATNGFLDPSLYDRDAWVYKNIMGKLICFNVKTVYSMNWFKQTSTWHNSIFVFGRNKYTIRAYSNAPDQKNAPEENKGKRRRKGKKKSKGAPALWEATIPVRPSAMVATGKALFCGGVDFTGSPDELVAADQRRTSQGVLVSLDSKTGKLLASIKLSAAPVWDGMAAANGALFVSAEDGSVSCYK